MKEEHIIKAISKVESFAGMTVNEMLYISGLDNEFYRSLETDKIIAEKILKHLKLDNSTIESILKIEK